MATQLQDHDSIPSSTTMEDEKVVREECEMANADIEAQQSRSEDEKIDSEVEPEDPYMVKWNGADDADNPLNFRTRRKLLVMVMIAAIAFLTYIAILFCRSSPP
jgi:MFS transporter, DHA1 family, multidrug resistance protein